MKRPDWEDSLQTPIGILPTGSGNALSASINHAAKYVSLFFLRPLLLKIFHIICQLFSVMFGKVCDTLFCIRIFFYKNLFLRLEKPDP